MSTKTVCRHCNKAYVNVLEHITKSHSWLTIYKLADNTVVDHKKVVRVGDYKTTLFWKDIEFDFMEHNQNTGNWAGITELLFCSPRFEGVVCVLIMPDDDNDSVLKVIGIETHVDRAFKRWSKEKGSFVIKEYKIPAKFNFQQFKTVLKNEVIVPPNTT